VKWVDFGLEWVMPQEIVELWTNWRGQCGSRCNLDAWRLAHLCFNVMYFEGA
jgi:hypothetical protein